MKAQEIATRCLEASTLATVSELLQGLEFDYADDKVVKEIAEQLEKMCFEVGKPVSVLCRLEKGEE